MRRIFAGWLAVLGLTAVPAWAGARMTFVGPKSVYAQIGLRTDDEVLNIDGKVPQTAGEVGQHIYAVRGDGKAHRILVRRSGQNVELKFR